MSGPTQRVMSLLSLLQRRNQWTGAELVERMEVDARTLRRDIERLRDLGYVIDSDRGVGGGYRLKAGKHLPPLVLDDDEAVAVAVGLRAATRESVADIELLTLSALSKLERLLPESARRRVDTLFQTVSWSRRQVDSQVDLKLLMRIAEATRNRQILEFEYENKSKLQTRRVAEPQHIVNFRGRWYMVAWDLNRRDWRTFRIDRVLSLEPNGELFGVRELPEAPVDFVARSLRSIPKEQCTRVIIDGPAEPLRWLLAWASVEFDSIDGQTQLTIHGSSVYETASIIALVATRHKVYVEAEDLTPDLQEILLKTSSRLGQSCEKSCV